MNTSVQQSWYEFLNILEDINLTIDNIAKYLSPISTPSEIQDTSPTWNTELSYKLRMVLERLRELDKTIKL